MDNEHLDSLKRDFILVIENTEPIWRRVEWLANCLVKHAARGEEVDKKYLASASTVSQLLTMAKKELIRIGDAPHMSRTDYPAIREEIADLVWNTFEEACINGDDYQSFTACETMGFKRN